MNLKNVSLRTVLMITLVSVALLPVLAAAIFAIPWYGASMRQEADKTLDMHATVALEQLKERQRTRVSQMESLIENTFSDPARRTSAALPGELERQSSLLRYDYMLWLDKNDVVMGSTTGEMGHKLDWPQLVKVSRSSVATSFVSIVPPTELYALGLSNKYVLVQKPAKGGSADASENAGALAIVSTAPVTGGDGRQIGTLVGIDVLKLDNTFVDQITGKVGGQATVFQNGVRVATTVRAEDKSRAVGTPVSDPVRRAVLENGKSFRGDAIVVGAKYIAAYDPLTDPDGKVVGMMFTGISNAPYQAAQVKFGISFLGVLALGLALATALAAFASRITTGPIERVSAAAEKIAAGDLTTVVPAEGYREAIVMGSAFNSMTAELRDILTRVGLSAGKLDSVSGEIADASRSEAESAQSQASSVSEATATIEELTRSFGAVADGAKRVLDIAEDSLEVAEDGRSKIEQGAGSVERMAQGALSVREAADSLADVAESIGQVTFVISSVAEQTKILALNAAIEAARAGEAGKGFGVVATEIRTLADSVSSSVSRIAALVGGIQSASKSLSATAAEQGELAQEGVSSAEMSRESLDSILEQMSRTASAAREIASAAMQQQTASRQIVEVMQQVSQGVTGTAASSQQLAESAGDVKREAELLARGLDRFRTQ